MKKIIYKVKVKKFFCVIVIIMLLSNLIVPLVMAVEENTEEDLTEEKENSADVGGILLSPIFWLINFVADAIESNLGTLMTGEGFTMTGATKLLQKKPIPHSGNNEPVEISIKSFAVGGIQYPNITYTPEEIFAGDIELLSIDFISGKINNGDSNSDSGWKKVRETVAQWYNVMRMIAIIGLLSVLVYTGIKIIISSNAKDKAKYKEWLVNWFMAVAILFAMHYIMAFIIAVTGEISDLIAISSQKINVTPVGGSGENFSTNLMGLVRFMIQSENFYIKVGYEIMYIALIVYTIKFTFIYLKRVLNMAFLTLIAPIVALTYPIDKISDGRAQGFDMWIKEYIFNALLQPMHQIMYYVLVGSAVNIVAKNPLYGIAVLMFMTEAEKLLKKIFGFDKANGGTVGGMASAFAAGAIASNISKIVKLPKGNAGKGNIEGANSYMDNLKPSKDPSATEGFENLLDNGNLNSGGESEQQNTERSEREIRNEDSSNDRSSSNEAGNKIQYEDMASENESNTYEEPNNNSSSDNTASEEPESSSSSLTDFSAIGDSLDDDTSRSNQSPDNKEPIREKTMNMKAIGKGLGNVGKRAFRSIWDVNKSKEYNRHRWNRRIVKGLKGAGKAAIGIGFGTAAAAVQAGISITDGKYNAMEGIASFTAGYAGGSGIASRVGRNVSDAFMEGYYEDNQAALLKKRKEQFMHDDKIDEAYQKKYQDSKKRQKMKELAKEQLVPYGITEAKDQFKVQKFANHIVDNKQGLNDEQKEELLKKAVDQGRRTQIFIENLTNQGQQKAINDPDQQRKYIDSMIKAEGVAVDSDRGKQITKSLNNAFKSAAVYQQVNRK